MEQQQLEQPEQPEQPPMEQQQPEQPPMEQQQLEQPEQVDQPMDPMDQQSAQAVFIPADVLDILATIAEKPEDVENCEPPPKRARTERYATGGVPLGFHAGATSHNFVGSEDSQKYRGADALCSSYHGTKPLGYGHTAIGGSLLAGNSPGLQYASFGGGLPSALSIDSTKDSHFLHPSSSSAAALAYNHPYSASSSPAALAYNHPYSTSSSPAALAYNHPYSASSSPASLAYNHPYSASSSAAASSSASASSSAAAARAAALTYQTSTASAAEPLAHAPHIRGFMMDPIAWTGPVDVQRFQSQLKELISRA
jgi:hypothetical protein